MFTQLRRIIFSGLRSFWRNGWLSGATIGMVILTLFTISSLVLTNFLLNVLLASVQDKIDISVYFAMDATETEILSIKEQLEEVREVKEVKYVSREEALNNFKLKHRDNAVLQESLEEIGGNPLQAVLNIKAKDPSFYASIASFLQADTFRSLIDKVNYSENETAISRLGHLIGSTRRIGFIVSLSLAIIAVLVTFNTIRLAIYSNRQEIEIMKLVGASNWFVRGPFIIEGIIYGIISALVVMLIVYFLVFSISSKLANFIVGVDLLSYFYQNIGFLILINLIFGISLGVFSSFFAVRRYLKV